MTCLNNIYAYLYSEAANTETALSMPPLALVLPTDDQVQENNIVLQSEGI